MSNFRIFSLISQKFLERKQPLDKKQLCVQFFEERKTLEINQFDVLTQPVSIQTPIHQFLASLILALKDHFEDRGTLK
jgi:hypothetical protein